MRRILSAVGLVLVFAASAAAQWRDVPYDPANFTIDGPLGWTPPGSAQKTFAYTLLCDTMVIAFQIDDFWLTTGFEPPYLKIRIPAHRVALRNAITPIRVKDDGEWRIGVAVAFAGQRWIHLFVDPSASTPWRASFDSSVQGEITVNVQP